LAVGYSPDFPEFLSSNPFQIRSSYKQVESKTKEIIEEHAVARRLSNFDEENSSEIFGVRSKYCDEQKFVPAITWCLLIHLNDLDCIPEEMRPVFTKMKKELDEKKVILYDKKTKIEISVMPQFPNLTSILNLLGDSLRVKTKYEVPAGLDYTLSSENVIFSQDSNLSILRIELSNLELRLLGVLPATPSDYNIEKAWLDHGLNDDSSASNLSDGIAFNNNLAAENRGRSTNFGDLNSTPPNSLIDKTFFWTVQRFFL